MPDHYSAEVLNLEIDQLAATENAIGGFKTNIRKLFKIFL